MYHDRPGLVQVVVHDDSPMGAIQVRHLDPLRLCVYPVEGVSDPVDRQASGTVKIVAKESTFVRSLDMEEWEWEQCVMWWELSLASEMGMGTGLVEIDLGQRLR